MPSVVYNSFILDLFNADTDLAGDNLKVMLTTAAYVPDAKLHTKRSDVTDEVVGAGYATGGIALTGEAVVLDAANNRILFDADDSIWPNSTIAGARYAVVFRSAGPNPTTDRLLFAIDFEANYSTNVEPFVIQWATLGLLSGKQV